MEGIKNYLKNEFWNGYNLFEKIFMISMVLLQIIVYYFVPDSPIGMICGVSGVICVVLTAKGKLSSYIFNFIQIVTYMYIVWGLGLYLEFFENIFYFVTCILGVFIWKKNMTEETMQVKAKSLKSVQMIITAFLIVICTIALGYIGQNYLGNTLPYYDAFTNVMAIVAQILMVLRYREQWLVWIVIDLVCLVMFIMLGQWSMVAMYVSWTINAIYGWYNWSKLNKEEVK
ncbi:nicotinamide mononucleotide transporter [Pradoshia sp. D12]|nr:nicotinamide riboside transporter PnuC [Bacillus sp. D12]QFK70748.1 nicotinamide mononucleotide transporter [Pradoshia sp. D12]TPF72541.1 nicotinamide mononucleotide transporter [Bacillus sp. D12]